MIKNDKWIKEKAKKGMIDPFFEENIKTLESHNNLSENQKKLISYGCSSYGYDICLDDSEFLVFNGNSGIIDPKDFDYSLLSKCELNYSSKGNFFILPKHTYGLGVASEYLDIPRNVTVVCVGKSTYARCGLILNVTPIESCLSKDTEVLTEQGWKFMKDLIIGEEILTYNPKKQISEYSKITEKQEYFIRDYLNHFQSSDFNQLVTDNHRMWVSERDPNNNDYKYKFRKAKEIIKNEKNNKQKSEQLFNEPRSCWKGSSKDLINTLDDLFQDKKQIKSFLQLIGMICSSCDQLSYEFQDTIQYNDLKNQKLLKECLDICNIKYENNKEFKIIDNLTISKIKKLIDLNSNNPSSLIRNTGIEYITEFIYGFIRYRDINLNKNQITMNIQSQNLILLSSLQEMIFKLGFKCPYLDFENHFLQIDLNKPTPQPINQGDIQKVPYVGMVYDVTVPNHIFLCRRGGVISWTGNSWKGFLTIEISNSSNSDCKIYANEGIAQILFFEGEDCQTSYSDRKGKYLNQKKEVTLPKM